MNLQTCPMELPENCVIKPIPAELTCQVTMSELRKLQVLRSFHIWSKWDGAQRKATGYSTTLSLIANPCQTLQNINLGRDFEIFGRRDLIQTRCWTWGGAIWLGHTAKCPPPPLLWGSQISSWKDELYQFGPYQSHKLHATQLSTWHRCHAVLGFCLSQSKRKLTGKDCKIHST